MNDEHEKSKEHSATVSLLLEKILALSEAQQIRLLKRIDDWIYQEKREINRKNCHIAVNYSIGGRLFSGLIVDISSQGAYIETLESHRIGEKIRLTFSLKGFGAPLKFEGQITRKTADGIGVRFLSLTQYQEEMIQIVVDRMGASNGSV